MKRHKLLESKRCLEKINQQSEGAIRVLGAGRFEESHRRVTIYLEWAMYERLQEERLQGQSQTRIINDALRQFWHCKP